MTKKQKRVLARILISGIFVIVLALLPLEGWIRGVLYLIPYLIIGWDILRKAALGVWHREIFDENFLMAVATVGAFLLALPGGGAVPELRRGQEPPQHRQPHGYPPGLRQHRGGGREPGSGGSG